MGIGFAIPIKMALQIKEQLISHGQVHRGKIGVYIQELDHRISKQLGVNQRGGVLIADVIPGSAGSLAGLKAGDVVLEMNDKHIESAADFRNRVSLTSPGKRISLEVLRDRKVRTMKVVVEALNPSAQKNTKKQNTSHTEHVSHFGLRVEELTKDQAEKRQLKNVRGMLITHVEEGSAAAKAGLTSGTIILSVNQRSTPDLTSFKREVKRSGNTLLLRVRMDRGVRFVVLSK